MINKENNSTIGTNRCSKRNKSLLKWEQIAAFNKSHVPVNLPLYVAIIVRNLLIIMEEQIAA